MNRSLTFVRFRRGGGFEIVFDQRDCGLDLRGCHGFCKLWRKHTWDGRSGLTYHHIEEVCVCVCRKRLGRDFTFFTFLRFYESLYSLSQIFIDDNDDWITLLNDQIWNMLKNVSKKTLSLSLLTSLTCTLRERQEGRKAMRKRKACIIVYRRVDV